MDKLGKIPAGPLLTPRSLSTLAERLRTARLEMCEHDECGCVTQEEHERNLARARARK